MIGIPARSLPSHRLAIAAALIATAFTASTTRAQTPEPIDTTTLDETGRGDILGNWIITDQTGTKTCRVTFDAEATIGGYVIEIDPACAATFPVMDDVAAWRLYEGWQIVLADSTRKELIRFTTPDDTYVAEPATDGIFTIARPK